jgi:predicted ATP-dependent endonuclease of OLD family
MKRSGAVARACQISSEDWTAIIDANQAVNRIAAKWPKLSAKLTEEDWQPEMEAVKHFLWLNAERSCLFFANHVLLVEGASEQAIINKLAGDGRLTGAAGGFYVLDCIGKYNIHRFMHLLVHMGIPHAVIYDDDDNKNEHAELNALIEASRDGALTLNAKSIPGKLEQFLGVPPAKAEHRKPQHLLYLYETGKVAPDKLAAFIALVEECLPKKAAADRKHAVSDTAKSP